MPSTAPTPWARFPVPSVMCPRSAIVLDRPKGPNFALSVRKSSTDERLLTRGGFHCRPQGL